MRGTWRGLAALIAAVVVLLAAVQPALAAPPEQGIGIGCTDHVCRLELDLGEADELLPEGAGIFLQVLDAGLSQLPGEPRLLIEDDVILSLPMGTIILPEAELVLELEDGKIGSITGTAAMPVPTFGFFSEAEWVTPARVSVGFDSGENLTWLNSELVDDHRYLYFDAQAGLHALRSDGVELMIPSGQQTTILVDTTQPLVYIDGVVKLRYTGDLAFVRDVVSNVPILERLQVGVGLPTTVDLSANATFGQGVTPSIELAAAYQLQPGPFGAWLKLEEPLLEAEGRVVLSGDGLLMAGQAGSALAPETVLDSAVAAEIFIPFNENQEAYAWIDSALDIPALGISRSNSIELGETDEMADASARLAPGKPALVAPDTIAEDSAAWWRVTGATLEGVAASAGTVANAAQQGYAVVLDGASQGYTWMSKGLGAGWDATRGQVCALTGYCAAPAAESTLAPLAAADQE